MSLSKKTSPIWGGLPLLGLLAFAVGVIIRAELWDNSDFASFDNPWSDPVITGGILLIVGLGVILGLVGRSRHKIWAFSFAWFIITILGVLTIILGILIRTEVLTEETADIFVKGDWLDFILIGSIALGFGLALFLGTLNEGPKARALVWKFTPLLLIVMLAGLALLLIGVAFEAETISSADLSFLEGYKWDEIYVIGLLLFIPALAIILTSLSDSSRGLIWKIWPLWVLIALAGTILATMGIFAAFYAFDQTTMAFEEDYTWLELMLYSIPLLVLGLGTLLASAPSGARYRMSKLDPVWVNLIGLGAIILGLDMLRRYDMLDSNFIALFAILPWDQFIILGLFPLTIGLGIFFSTRTAEPVGFVSADISVSEESSADPSQISKNPGEQLAYLDISLEATRTSLASLREKQRKKEITDNFAKKLFGRFSLTEKRLIKMQERVKREAERADLRRAFEAETKPKERKVPKPPPPAAAEAPTELEEKKPAPAPTPTPSATPKPPTTPPKTPPPGPPKPPATPSATPPKAPGPPSPAPSPPTAPKDASLLTKAADTQSTSISELRGEMLKELRRLRDIFKEE